MKFWATTRKSPKGWVHTWRFGRKVVMVQYLLENEQWAYMGAPWKIIDSDAGWWPAIQDGKAVWVPASLGGRTYEGWSVRT